MVNDPTLEKQPIPPRDLKVVNQNVPQSHKLIDKMIFHLSDYVTGEEEIEDNDLNNLYVFNTIEDHLLMKKMQRRNGHVSKYESH